MEKEPKRTTKVKVVASRYAQSLQKQNLDTRQATARTRSAPSVSTAAAGGATKRPASSISQDSSAAPAKAHGGLGAARAESAAPPSDLRDRLAAYRANKAQVKQANSAGSKSKPQASTGKPLSMQRPAFPQRISTPERPVKRPAKTPAAPKETRTLSFSHDSALSGKSFKPATSSAKAPSVVAAAMSGDEEIELLQSLYYQLCFAEAKAADTFRRQEQSAETQMIAAWNLLQSKLQLVHDTMLRLDRDKHVKAVEEHLSDQATPFVQAATALPAFMENLRQMCASLETSLHCMPTPGISCNPRHVKRHLEQLGIEVDTMLDQLQASSIDTTVADAVAFESEMKQMMAKFNTSLLQIATLLEELQHEVNTESSLVIQHIQQKRVDSSTANLWM